MRTSKIVSISLPPALFQRAEELAKKENRTMSELIREALRYYQKRQQIDTNSELLIALRAVQREARRTGLDKLSSREIDTEISAHRREKAIRKNRPKERTKRPVK